MFTSKLSEQGKLSANVPKNPTVSVTPKLAASKQAALSEFKAFDPKGTPTTVPLKLDGKPIESVVSKNDLLEEPGLTKPATITAKIEDVELNKRWKLNWPLVDYKSFKNKAEKARQSSARDPSKNMGVRAFVRGMKVDEKLDETRWGGLAPKNFKAQKIYASGKPVDFSILELPRRQNIKTFSRPAD